MNILKNAFYGVGLAAAMTTMAAAQKNPKFKPVDLPEYPADVTGHWSAQLPLDSKENTDGATRVMTLSLVQGKDGTVTGDMNVHDFAGNSEMEIHTKIAGIYDRGHLITFTNDLVSDDSYGLSAMGAETPAYYDRTLNMRFWNESEKTICYGFANTETYSAFLGTGPDGIVDYPSSVPKIYKPESFRLCRGMPSEVNLCDCGDRSFGDDKLEKDDVFDGFLYDEGTANITNPQEGARLAEYLKNHPQEKVQITASTEPRGTYKALKKLSEARAKAASELLEEFGVDRRRVEAVGIGSRNYAGTNQATEEDRQLNRRAVIKIIQPN